MKRNETLTGYHMLYQYNGMTNGMYCFTCVDDSAMLGDVAGTASFNYMVGDFQYDATKPQLNKGDVVSVELLKRPRVTKRLEWDPFDWEFYCSDADWAIIQQKRNGGRS